MDIPNKIVRTIADCSFCISYHPTRIEIDPKKLPFRLPDKRATVPANPYNDPKVFGLEVTKKFGNLPGFVLVPGRKFDRYGGRHGKGYGWYDRFLSIIPTEWVRIGICSKNEFSDTKLALQKWDAVVDWVIVYDAGVYKFYETNAR